MATASKLGTLALGLGALVGNGGQASASVADVAGSGASLSSGYEADDVRVRLEDDKVFVSEHGQPFTELVLGDTSEAEKFKKLLIELLPAGGVLAVPVGSSIVADGGASGSWSRPKSKTGSSREGK